MMKTTRHSLMAKGILVLLSLLILIFVFTYSWFVDPSKPVEASGLSLTTSASADFDIAFGFSTDDSGGYRVSKWYSGNEPINFSSIEVEGVETTFDLMTSFVPVDLTSDGVTFVRPEMEARNAGINLTKNNFEYAIPNEQYLSFDIYVRSEDNGMKIRLGDSSDVFGVVEGGQSNSAALIGSSVTRKSAYGNFSEDSVVGAVRVSFVNYTGLTPSTLYSADAVRASTPVVLWIPRADIFLQDTGTIGSWVLHDSDDNDWNSGSVTDVMNQTQTYKGISEKHYYYAIFVPDNEGHYAGGSDKYRVYSGVNNPVVTDLSAEPILMETSIAPTSDTYYYNRCQVNIWIDGCDTEARRAIDKGQFQLKLEITTSG